MVSFSGSDAGHIRRCLAGAANRRQVWCCPFSRPGQGGADSNEADERQAETRGSETVARRPLSSGTTFTTAASLRKDRPGSRARSLTGRQRPPLPSYTQPRRAS
jgi:hypothetical protein